MNFSKSTFTIGFLLLLFSCEKSDSISIDDPVPFPEEDCHFKFESGLEPIYGLWEPKIIINLEDDDTSYYPIGEGPFGFMLNDHYADSFEFRSDSSLSLYYIEAGPPCVSRNDGTWYYSNDTIFLTRKHGGDLKKLPVLELSETELVLKDTIDFKSSKATFRKNE